MTIEKLHEILRDLLYAIDDACRQENVSYCLEGGTMLGAVRHQGFIPWDDDVDICIWGHDYPAFKRAMEKHLPEYYRLVEPMELAPYFYDFVYRVEDLRYNLHTPSEKDDKMGNLQNHVCVDVFIVNYSANTAFAKKFYVLKHQVLYGLAAGHRIVRGGTKKTWVQKFEMGLLSAVGKHIPIEKIHRWYWNLAAKYENTGSKYCIISNDLPHYLGLPYETAWFSSTIPVKFENRMLPVRVGYHEAMTLLYGDYMQPPKDRSKYVSHMTFEKSESPSSR